MRDVHDDIIVVGSGFAGFWASLAARRIAGRRLGITLVSRAPVLQMRPRLYEAFPESLAVDLRPHLSAVGVGFMAGEVTSLDIDPHAIKLATGERRNYERLIVTTGSQLRRPPVLGAGDAFSIDSQPDAIVFDLHLREIARAVERPSIAVVGAGFTGIELALELRARVAVHNESGVAERLQIHLFDRAPLVGPELGASPRPIIERALETAGVVLHLGVSITALARDRITLKNGSTFCYDAVVLTTGMSAAPFASQIPGAHDDLGRVCVDRALRAPAAPHVFVAGDAAAATISAGGPLALQSCQHALQMGRFAGENAARDLLDMPLLSYEQLRYVTCLDLGRSGALWTEGWDRAVTKTGAEAKTLKQWINRVVIYPPPNLSSGLLMELSSTDPAIQRDVRDRCQSILARAVG
jgi:NADH dehydrogenase